MQLIGKLNSIGTLVRRTEHVRVSTLEIQPICSVNELDTRLALCNGIRVYMYLESS